MAVIIPQEKSVAENCLILHTSGDFGPFLDTKKRAAFNWIYAILPHAVIILFLFFPFCSKVIFHKVLRELCEILFRLLL